MFGICLLTWIKKGIANNFYQVPQAPPVHPCTWHVVIFVISAGAPLQIQVHPGFLSVPWGWTMSYMGRRRSTHKSSPFSMALIKQSHRSSIRWSFLVGSRHMVESFSVVESFLRLSGLFLCMLVTVITTAFSGKGFSREMVWFIYLFVWMTNCWNKRCGVLVVNGLGHGFLGYRDVYLPSYKQKSALPLPCRDRAGLLLFIMGLGVVLTSFGRWTCLKNNYVIIKFKDKFWHLNFNNL